jgi:hypothetical protein
VVIANPLILHHVLEVADDGGGTEISPAGRDQRLVLVQGDGAGGTHRAEGNPAALAVQLLAAAAGDDLGDLVLRTGNIGHTV